MKRFPFAGKPILPMAWPAVRTWKRAGRRRNEEDRRDAVAAPAAAAGFAVNVMSFNIRRGTARDGRNRWDLRRSLVQEILKGYRPDVLGLQEALDFQISEVGAMLPGYGQTGIGTRAGGKGLHNAVFYDAVRFSLSGGGTFWFSDTPDVPGSKGWGNILPRNCTWVRLIERRSGQGFYFYNVHLDHISRRSRKKSVLLLTQHIHRRPSPDPFILTGDFNTREKSGTIQYLKGKRIMTTDAGIQTANPVPMFDSFRVCHPDRKHVPTFHGFNRFIFRFRIDYIFVPDTVLVRDAEVVTLRWKKRYPSDHYPLFARLILPDAKGDGDTDKGERG